MKKSASKAVKKKTKPQVKSRKRKHNLLAAALVAIALLLTSAAGIGAYKKNWEETRDTSVIGNGTPAIVQIHDPGCRLCRQLKSNTESALRGIDDDRLQYRIADITTTHGRALQRKHEVPHVTLLFFDGKGELRRNMNGVKSTATVRKAIDHFLGREES